MKAANITSARINNEKNFANEQRHIHIKLERTVA